MDLVERYIDAVKFWLPAKIRDDIAAELAEDIRSEIEEAEAEKGRPLTEEEISALLKARGTPLQVASRYLPQRVLIGPELFPIYIFVLKIVAAACFIPPLLGLFASIAHIDSIDSLAVAVPVNSLLTSFAIVTLIFAVIEYKGISPEKLGNWNPATLRPVRPKNRIKRSESIGDIIGSLIVLGFYAAGYLSQTTYHLPGYEVSDGIHRISTATVTLCPQWIPYWQMIVFVVLADTALSAANLFRPYWSATRAVVRMALALIKTAAFFWLVQNHLLQGISIPGVPPHTFDKLVEISDRAAELAQPMAAAVAVIIVATAVARLIRAARKPAAA